MKRYTIEKIDITEIETPSHALKCFVHRSHVSDTCFILYCQVWNRCDQCRV